MAVVTCDDQPTKAHQANFNRIVERWQKLWPEFKQVIGQLMVSYHRDPPEWSLVNCVYINTPSEPFAEGAEWSIGVVFSGETTLWTLPHEGWSACPKQAQAIY